MKVATAVSLLLLSICLMAAFLLGASFLDQDLTFGLDAGVVAASVSLIGASVAGFLVTTPTTRSRRVATIALAAAVAWLPFSIALAGGTQLSYSGWRTWAWLVFTGSLLLAILGTWASALLSWVTSRNAA